MAQTLPTLDEVQKGIVDLYIAYFNRAPETKGLNDWTNYFYTQVAQGKDPDAVYIDMANQFFGLGFHFQALPPNLQTDNTALVKWAYQNVLGRDLDAEAAANTPPADPKFANAAEEAYQTWVPLLDNGTLDKGAFFVTLIDVARNFENDPSWGWVYNYLEARNTLGLLFAKSEEGNITDPDQAIAVGKQVLTGLTPDQVKANPNVDPQALAQQVFTQWEATQIGQTFTLTAGADTFVGTSGNDTIIGTSATFGSNDVIIDQNSKDNDVFNLTLTSALAAANSGTVTGIENVNINWDAFGTAAVDAGKISGATINLTSSKLGFLGNAQVDNVGNNNVVAGAGMVGTLTVNGAKNTVVDAVASKTVTVNGTNKAADNKNITVKAGAETTNVTVTATAAIDAVAVTGGAKTTTVSVRNSKNTTIDAAAATAVTVQGTTGTTDKAVVTLGVDATLTTGDVEDLTVNTADGKKVTLAGTAALGTTTTIGSTGTATLVATSAQLDDKVVKSAAESLVVEFSHVGADTLEKVEADQFVMTSAAAAAITFATGANVLLKDNVLLNGSTVFKGTSADTGVLNLTVQNDQIVDIKAQDLKTLNLTVALKADDADKVARLAGITSTKDVNLKSSDKVTIAALDVENFNASAATGELTISDTGANLKSVVGSQGKNTITLGDFTNDISVVTAEGADTVNLGDNATSNLTLVLGNGNNTVDGNLKNVEQTLSIVTGSGNDTLSAIQLSGDNAVLAAELGAGNNSVELGFSDNTQTATLVTGGGNDTVKLLSDTYANTTFSWTSTGGTNTLDLNGNDASSGTISVSGLTHVWDSDGAGVVNGNLLKGQTYTIQGNGNAATQLDVVISSAGTYDFSKLVLDNTLTKGIGGLDVAGSTGADVIIGTAGNDNIDGSGGNDTITGGQGQDTLTGGAGNDIFVFAIGDTGKTNATADVISDFTTSEDKLKMGIAGSATTFAAVDADNGAGNNDLLDATAAVTFADGASGFGTNHKGKNFLYLYDSDGGADGWLAIDWDGNGTTDGLIKLTGLTSATGVVAGDIIA